MDIKALRGLSGTYNVRANERDRAAPRNIECLVQFLNNTQHTFIIDRRSKGQFLLDCVFKYLNLIETDFFGLKFTPQESHSEHSINQLHSQPQIINITNNSVPLSSKAQSLNSYDNSPISITSLSSSSAVNTVASDHYSASVTPAIVTSSSKPATIAPTLSNTVNNCNRGNYGTPNNNNNNNNNNYSHTSSVSEYTLKEVSGKHDDNISSTFHEERWLDPTKSIRKQYKSGPPYKFFFRVKFYVSDPSKLADDTTRTHLYLQLRQDILRKRLVVPPCSAILLASYILQSEVGDYKRELLEKDYASDFRLLPDQNDDIKEKVIELHKQHKSLSSADAEYQFLEHAAKQLDCYGVEFFDARDSCKDDVLLGVSSNGLVVFKGGDKVSQFSWAKIIKIMFKKKIFSIQLRRCEGVTCDNFIEFNLLTNQACKTFWEECVAQHSFFRLHQPKSPPKKFFSFLNFGSKFQYNGKTEYQTMEESRKRSFSHFSRTPSKRYARRTIPIGRPSWSDSQDNKRVGEVDAGNEGDKARDICEIDGPSSNGVDPNVSTWIYAAPNSSGATIVTDRYSNQMTSNGATDPKSPAYRPKSLTLKSFMYIDESKNALNTEHDKRRMESSDEISSGTYCQANQSQSTPNQEPGSFKKDLKRSESLRISNSIKGALSLTKKAGVSSGSQLARISESIRDKFLAGKSKPRKLAKTIHEEPTDEDSDLDLHVDKNFKVVSITPGKDGKFGFKIREITITRSSMKGSKVKKVKDKSIIIYDISPNSPAATCSPKLCEGDQIVEINGVLVDGLSESKVEALIKGVHHQKPPTLTLYIISRTRMECASSGSSCSQSEARSSPASAASGSQNDEVRTLAESITHIKQGLETKDLILDFEKLSRRKEDESLDESKSMENIDKNRYRDILPYDSTRVPLLDAMSGDYINASFVDMPVPSGLTNRYIATQGPLASTCEDFWQMVWEQNCSLIIMVTPLIEAGRVKCHKYWPDEKEDIRYGQLLVRNMGEKSRAATIDRTIQLIDIKSDKKRTATQIQYRAWPDHEIPEDCSDFLKLVKRVRKHRASKPQDPIVVHCSAGIGRTGVLILMETAICIMESGEPVYPIKILEEMRKQRAMLIQTNSQFQFVSDAICKVYDQKLYKRSHKHRKE